MRRLHVLAVFLVVLVILWHAWDRDEQPLPQESVPPPAELVAADDGAAAQDPALSEQEVPPAAPEPVQATIPDVAEDASPAQNRSEESSLMNLTRFDPMGFQKRSLTTTCGRGEQDPSTGDCVCYSDAILVDRRCKSLVDLCGLELFTYDPSLDECGRSRDCDSIESKEWRDDCLMMGFVDPMDCPKLQGQENRRICQERFSAGSPVISVPCERVKDVKQRDVCLLSLGLMSLDERVCRLIDRSGRKEDCLAEIDSAFSSCAGADTASDQALCYSRIAAKAKNPLICDRIPDRSLRRGCQVQAKRGGDSAASSGVSDFSGVTLVR